APDVDREAALGELERDPGEHAADERIARPHVAVGHHRVQQRERDAGNTNGSTASNALPTILSRSQPKEAPMANEVIDRLPPISTGPSVITAQYISTCCSIGRRRCTRNRWLSAVSMVVISITAVTKKNPRPIAVRRPALLLNVLICSITVSMPAASGSTFSSRKSCSALIASSNTGNALATASATVISGTC